MKQYIPREDKTEIKILENSRDRNKKRGFKEKEVTKLFEEK